MTDTEREWIIDAREQTCEQCGREYRSLSQHWARSADCSYRDLTDRQHETVRGLLLGDGSLGGRESPNLRVESVRREHIVWLHDELAWLSRGVSQFEKDGSTVYRLTTMSHPALGRYLAWRSAPPQSGWTLTRQTARVWYACDGSLSAAGRDGGTAQISFAAMDKSKQAALVAALDRAGFEARAWDRRVGLAGSAMSDWLDWLGEPTPGSEHKWALDPSSVARRARTSRRSSENSGANGETSAPAQDRRATPRAPFANERARKHALRRVADHLDTDTLSTTTYESARWDVEPTAAMIISHDGRWATALDAAGLKPDTPGAKSENPGRVSIEECERALVAYLDVSDGRVTMDGYDRWRAENDSGWPHSHTVMNHLGDGSWTDAVESVRERSPGN